MHVSFLHFPKCPRQSINLKCQRRTSLFTHVAIARGRHAYRAWWIYCMPDPRCILYRQSCRQCADKLINTSFQGKGVYFCFVIVIDYDKTPYLHYRSAKRQYVIFEASKTIYIVHAIIMSFDQNSDLTRKIDRKAEDLGDHKFCYMTFGFIYCRLCTDILTV